MDERTSGLILRTRPLTETSLIVSWLTPDLGRLATVAKGARRPKSPFRGKLDLFYLADFSFARSRRSELHILREVSLRETRDALRHELAYLQQAAYCTSLIEQTTETETPLPSIYQLLNGFLAQLTLDPPQARTVLAFEIKLLNELGLQPATVAKRRPWLPHRSALTETDRSIALRSNRHRQGHQSAHDRAESMPAKFPRSRPAIDIRRPCPRQRYRRCLSGRGSTAS